MSDTEHTGRCSCGARTYHIALPDALASHSPRACDCDFCQARSVAWLSAPGARIRLDGAAAWDRQRQGSGQALFLCCPFCQDLLAVVAEFDDGWRGAVNGNLGQGRAALGAPQVVSPRKLDAQSKRSRWGELWGRVMWE